MNDRVGTVYFAGGGAVRPPLMSIRLLELLDRADAIVYDRHVEVEAVHRSTTAVERIEVRDEVAGETVTRLAELTARYAVVVRLLADDPFVSERGTSEVGGLVEKGIRFEVLPGPPISVAAATCAGIPLIHPGIATGVSCFASPIEMEVAEHLAEVRGRATVVLYTSVSQIQDDCRILAAAGFGRETAAAAILNGATPRQRVIEGTLGSVHSSVSGNPQETAVLIVGDVVRLRQRFHWYESRPLFGKRIVVTRARAQAGGFASDLEALGAEVVLLPTIRTVDPVDPEPLRRAVAEVDRFDWIVFTSVNGVERFWGQLRAAARDTRALSGVSLCAIGPATAAAIELEGARADVVPEQFVAEGVIEALSAEVRLEGSRILLPRAEIARSVLPDALREKGAEVVEVDAYRTVADGTGAEHVVRSLESGTIDLITFTASSTVRNFVELVGTGVGSAAIGCIGPITAATARELGLPVSFEAKEYTIPGLLQAICAYYSPHTR